MTSSSKYLLQVHYQDGSDSEHRFSTLKKLSAKANNVMGAAHVYGFEVKTGKMVYHWSNTTGLNRFINQQGQSQAVVTSE